MNLTFENRFISVVLELEPFFEIKSFTDRKTGKNLLSTRIPKICSDREILTRFQFLSHEESGNVHILKWKTGDITLVRRLFFYDAPAIRWYDTLEAENDHAAMYYSTLADLTLETEDPDAKTVNYFSCSDQSNHRLLETPARNGRCKGAYYVGNGIFLYKEGPMPDCQPMKGEFDFIINGKSVEMVGLGFDNLHKGELRRANGVVIGLTRDFGLPRYQSERYANYAVSAREDVLSNSWPDLTFGVSEEAIEKEIHSAAEAGINCVFIDDGWFSTFMGDIDTVKFPNQFTKLSELARRYGIELGLWCNPLGLDVRHPKMKLWDGAECHDSMLEENPWNWAARTDDFEYAELKGDSQSSRSYAPIDLMVPDAFEFMKNKLIALSREFGFKHFKFDLYQLISFNTLRGDANLHYEKYRDLLTALQKAVPELVISMDVTRRNRPNFDFALDYGRLFLENRGRSLNDHRYYHPYMALGNFWYTLKYAPARQLEIEMMPQALDYPLEYILGTTIFGTPLYWGCIANTPKERRDQMKSFFAKANPIRKKISGYLTTAAGDMPAKGTTSGILSVAPDDSEGYVALYRNGNENNAFSMKLPFGTGFDVIFGGAEIKMEKGTLSAVFAELYDFVFIHFYGKDLEK